MKVVSVKVKVINTFKCHFCGKKIYICPLAVAKRVCLIKTVIVHTNSDINGAVKCSKNFFFFKYRIFRVGWPSGCSGGPVVKT